MRIAVFDYETVATNPYGKGLLHVLEALCDEHEFTVYSLRFDNPRPDRIRWRRVPAAPRPLLALLVTFLVASQLSLWFDRLIRRWRFDLVQAGEGAVFHADVVCAQFCHRAYLRHHWSASRPRGVRRLARSGYERLAARLEPLTMRSAGAVVVPSRGLAAELTAEYAHVGGRVRVIPNAITDGKPVGRDGLDRAGVRSDLGWTAADVGAVFVALGHFERKGLPLVMDALAQISDPSLKLLVIGGKHDLVAAYRRRAAAAGVADRVQFVGEQRDVSRLLRAADLFVFPSAYETFSYVTFEAAIAGLPLVVTRLYGVEDAFIDGESALIVDRTAAAVAAGLRRMVDLGSEGRRALGAAAAAAATAYTVDAFVSGWREVYRSLDPGCGQTA